MIRFCVSDTGIAPDALDRIFEPFIQLDCSLARRPVGTGLGLALVRRLAEIHGGSVECTSTPGRGSTFVVRLPQGLPGPAAAATPTQSPPTRPTRTDGEVRPSVVIVDEHEVNLTLLSRWFPPRDRRVAVARDGGRPSSGMRAMFADVVRMDIQMPTMGGFAAIRADQEIADISIIAVTALTMPGDHQCCLNGGPTSAWPSPSTFRTCSRWSSASSATISAHRPRGPAKARTRSLPPRGLSPRQSLR